MPVLFFINGKIAMRVIFRSETRSVHVNDSVNIYNSKKKCNGFKRKHSLHNLFSLINCHFFFLEITDLKKKKLYIVHFVNFSVCLSMKFLQVVKLITVKIVYPKNYAI